MISFILSPLGRVLLGLVFVAGLLAAAWFDGYASGLRAERTTILTRSVEVLRERSRVDDEVSAFDDMALCNALGGVWVLTDGSCQ